MQILSDICNLDGISYFITIIQDITKRDTTNPFHSLLEILTDSFNMTVGFSFLKIFKGSMKSLLLKRFSNLEVERLYFELNIA